MTHLSDFSYLERCTIEVFVTAYMVRHIWVNDRFRCLHPSKILAGELRTIITYLMFIMMCTQASWDIISTWIKYNEGFILVPNRKIITKPFDYWEPYHQKFIQPIDYVECVTFSFQTGVFFLLQCFWNYLSNNVAKRSFMGSWEFRFYIIWALGSMAMFPILQWRWRDHELYSEVVPQLAYAIEVLITAGLGVRSHFRFARLLQATRLAAEARAKSMKLSGDTSVTVIARLEYFRDMNVMLVIVLMLYGASLVILCADGLTPAMTINTNKFATDLLIANCNMCIVCLWFIFISIFHPRRQHLDKNETKEAEKTAQRDEEEPAERRMSKFVLSDVTKQYNNNSSQWPPSATANAGGDPLSYSPTPTAFTSMNNIAPSYYGRNVSSPLHSPAPLSPPPPTPLPPLPAQSASGAEQREGSSTGWLRQSPERRTLHLSKD